MALRLDGQIIAAKIVVETHGRLEGFLTTFDPEYSRFSPGQILLRDTFVWCAKAGLAYDFRIGDEAYKLEWTSTAANVTNYVLPLNRAGALLHRTRVLRREACAAKNRLRERIPTGVRRVLKELLLGGSPTAEA
jgi:CelD/BcsL family acetyltransferase involved in cellulose biosynthesis